MYCVQLMLNYPMFYSIFSIICAIVIELFYIYESNLELKTLYNYKRNIETISF